MKKKAKPRSLRRTLLSAFFLSALICFAVGIYNFLSIRFLLDDMSAFVADSQRLSAVQTDITALQDDIDEYLFSRDPLVLDSYRQNAARVETHAEEILDHVIYDDSGIRLKNLGHFLERYLQNAERIMEAKTNEDYDVYVSLYTRVTSDYTVLTEKIQDILLEDLQESAQQYDAMQSSIQLRTTISYALFAASILLVATLLYSLSNQVTNPIERLVEYARQVAGGDYSVTVDEDAGSEELGQLYDAFGVMLKNTRLYLEGLEEKQNLENELSQAKIKSLETDNLLHQTELQALHAQMNPHFIFNTINIGAQLALLEGDIRTRTYLENAAQVFRYNLDGLGDATLAAELEHVSAYMGLLTIRFGHKLRYRQVVDSRLDTARYTLPRMTLQPLVENAFVHGVSPCEEGGEISVEVRADGDRAVVVISNTGQPFPPERIESLYMPVGVSSAGTGHVSGIGLRNVVKRLQLQFQQERPLEISSAEGTTIITLTIPPGTAG